MNGAARRDRLPPSIGGLVDAGVAAWAKHWLRYTAFATLIVAAGVVVELLSPPGTAPDSAPFAQNALLLLYAMVLADSFVIANVALGVGAQLVAEPGTTPAFTRPSLQSWFAVLGSLLFVQLLVFYTSPFSGLNQWGPDSAWQIFTAPFVWLLWGVFSLAPPTTALSTERPYLALVEGLVRAVALSLHPRNLPRLPVVAFISLTPTLLQTVVYDQLSFRHSPHVEFLANVPLDALTIGPVVALQTAFALDFARRVSAERSSGRGG